MDRSIKDMDMDRSIMDMLGLDMDMGELVVMDTIKGMDMEGLLDMDTVKAMEDLLDMEREDTTLEASKYLNI